MTFAKGEPQQVSCFSLDEMSTDSTVYAGCLSRRYEVLYSEGADSGAELRRCSEEAGAAPEGGMGSRRGSDALLYSLQELSPL